MVFLTYQNVVHKQLTGQALLSFGPWMGSLAVHEGHIWALEAEKSGMTAKLHDASSVKTLHPPSTSEDGNFRPGHELPSPPLVQHVEVFGKHLGFIHWHGASQTEL